MKLLLKAYYALRVSMIRAQQHDLQVAWSHTKRTENNPLAIVHYRQAVYQRQNQLAEQREYFESKLNMLKTSVVYAKGV